MILLKINFKFNPFIFISIYGYKILLDIIFCNYISKIFDYQGFTYSFSPKIMLFSYIAIFFVFLAVNHLLKDIKFSNIVILLLLIMYYIPVTTIVSYCKNDFSYLIFASLYFFIILLLNRLLNIKKIRPIKISAKKRSIDMFVVITVLLSIIMVLISGIYSGFRISFDLSEFYELRFEARELSMPSILQYILHWARYIIPIGLVYCLVRKKYSIATFLSFAQILSFSFNGKKSSLFLFFLAFIIAFFFKDKYWKKLPIIFFAVLILAIFETIFHSGSNLLIIKYIVRRVFMTPSYLGWAYFDFFSNNELDFLRGSILRRIGFVSPYQSIPRLIGSLYTTSSSLGANNANTGLCGDAFSNFGWVSLLIYPFLIVLSLKILERCMNGLEKEIKAITCITVSYMLLNGTFFKILLTNGYILICIILLFCKRKNNIISEEEDKV